MIIFKQSNLILIFIIMSRNDWLYNKISNIVKHFIILIFIECFVYSDFMLLNMV